MSFQALLRRIVWPRARRDSLQHDSYTCAFRGFVGDPGSSVAPFPTRRDGGRYVGWGPVRGGGRGGAARECPEACRRRPDWKTC